MSDNENKGWDDIDNDFDSMPIPEQLFTYMTAIEKAKANLTIAYFVGKKLWGADEQELLKPEERAQLDALFRSFLALRDLMDDFFPVSEVPRVLPPRSIE